MIRVLENVLVGLFLAACAATTIRAWELPQGVKALPVNEYQMAYLDQGSGETVILVHGTVGDYRDFQGQVTAFSSQYRVIAPSLRHYYPEPWDGKSTTLTMPQHVSDLAVFIRTLNAGKVHLVGFSRGGQVALQMASEHPELLRSLVLADPAPMASLLAKSEPGLAALERRRAFVTASMQHFQRGDIEAGLETFIDGVTAPGGWAKFSEPDRQAVRENAWTITSLLADAKEALTCDEVSRITVPVLLVSGERSPDEYRFMQDALQPCLPRHDRAVIPKSGHLMLFANPGAFNALLLEFFSKNSSTNRN